jgi:hypothetical protein
MNIPSPRLRRILRACAMVSLMAGCAPHSDITANKMPEYQQEPKRIFVVSYIGNDYGGNFYDDFKERLASGIRACGADFELTTVSPLDLDNKVHVARLAAFRPDAVLSLKHPNGTIGTRNQQGIIHLIYAADLVEMASKKTVWRANIDFHTGDAYRAQFSGKGYIGEALADEMIGQLKKDGILHSCPTKN